MSDRHRVGLRRAVAIAIAIGAQFQAQHCPAATVAHWSFEEGVAGVLATIPGSIIDSSNNGLNGSPGLGPLYVSSTVPGSNVAVRFDGWLDQITVTDNPLLELTHSLTLEAAVWPVGLLADPMGGVVLHRGDARPGLDPYTLRVRQDMRLEFIIHGMGGGEAVLVSPNALAPDRFQQVAGTLDDASNEMKLFVEGIEVARLHTEVRPIGPLDAASAPGIGVGALSQGGQHFYGRIDEVRISDVAVTASQFLFPPAIGDATGDRIADGVDYTIWADHFLQTADRGAAGGDFSHDGTVDGADYTLWADNFSPASPMLAAVPEPSGFILAGIGGLALMVRIFANATPRAIIFPRNCSADCRIAQLRL